MLQIQNRRYLGNKFKLIDFIQETVDNVCPDVHSVFDVFAGTGIVAYSFMDRARIIANDILYSNHLSHIAFMSREQINYEHLYNLLNEYNNLDVHEDNYMSNTFANTYFSLEDCRKIGYIREDIEKNFINENINRRERAYLITSLLYGMDKIAQTCGHYDAYRKGAEFKNHLFLDELDISERAIEEPVLFHADSNEVVRKNNFPAVDLVYCDPPYNSRNYGDTYHLLENVAEWKKPEVFGVAKKMNRDKLKSKYCTRTASVAFADLVENLNCRYIILSYNNTGRKADDRSNAKMSDEDIMDILQRKGNVEVYTQQYKAFTPGKSDNQDNEERLFVCRVR